MKFVKRRVLFTSVGRRVALIRAFRRGLGDNGTVFAGDADNTAPGLLAADQAFILPPVRSEDYVPTLVRICRDYRVDLLVPLIDPELPVLARSRSSFEQIGTVLLLSNDELIEVADDKRKTARAFEELGIPGVRTWLPDDALEMAGSCELRFPVVVKPRAGSSGQGVTVCENLRDLQYAVSKVPDGIVQPVLVGSEVTIDVLGDGTGRVLGMVPRKRLKVRGGEVERGVTVDHEPFLPYVSQMAAHLKPFGPINVQCFLTPEGPVFTEINARFGGGYPLADAAGAQFPEMILEMLENKSVAPRLGQYVRGLVMARFDEAFYTPLDKLPGGSGIAEWSNP